MLNQGIKDYIFNSLVESRQEFIDYTGTETRQLYFSYVRKVNLNGVAVNNLYQSLNTE